MLVGAWRRSGLWFDGARQVDHCDVMWLQTPEWFADIRLRLDPSSTPPPDGLGARFAKEVAFGGIGTWEEPLMTWAHHFDTRPSLPLDANPLHPEDGVMMERGTIADGGRDVPFAEEWLRLTGDDPKWAAVSGDGSLRVEVGRWAVEITELEPGGPSRATRYDLVDGDWIVAGAVPVAAVGSVVGPAGG
jgi:hypothetical protein